MKSGYKAWSFFVPWTAFSLFWMAGASGFRLPTFESGWSLFPLFGLPFLLIGIAGLASPIWQKRKAYSIVYAITNQRAFIMQGTKSVTVKSFRPVDIENLERTEHQGGFGDLLLKTEFYRDSRGRQRGHEQGFFAIADVRRVERMIEALVHRADVP
ncbi:hypothetical protein [Caldimonas brevitalea]|nr:hypothetical protein [Caldimonas brevitalea]